MIPLLVLRPEPGAAATAARARALGLEAIVAPLFTIAPVGFTLPPRLPDALLLTSANAVRMLARAAPEPTRHPGRDPGSSPLSSANANEGGPRIKSGVTKSRGAEQPVPALLAALTHLPVYAVGEATAAAARRAGFLHVVAGSNDAAAIVARAAADGLRHLLHLAGRDHRAVTHPGVTIERAIVYAAVPAPDFAPGAKEALAREVVALVHSLRAAARLAALVPDCARHAIAAISPAAARAAGSGWRTVAIAAAPTDAALLAVAARLCEGGG